LKGYCIESPEDVITMDNIDLKITARCEEDGTVEAFEIEELKIFCIMWHPERSDPSDSIDLSIFAQHFSLY
jgi:gamma-glutamyl-gamma-aminobutyrate hydrolase PuuD